MLEPGRRTEGDLLDLPNFHDDEDFEDDGIEPARPWWRRPKGIAILCGVLILALLVGGFAFLRTRPKPLTYQYATVTTGNLITTVSATGPVQSALYDVNFSGSGKIAEIDVSVGQQVKAGQVLAKLDPTSLQDALNQAQAQANEAYDTEQNAIFQCDNEKNPPPNCIQAAEDAYAAALAALQTAQHNLANATLTAPHAGTVTQINGVVGGTPGTSTATSGSSSSSSSSSSSGTFIQIADLSSLQVVADVNEADIGSVAVNEPVTFTVSAYSNHTFRGTVSSISPIGQTTSNVVTYPVTINLTNSTGANSASTAGAAGSYLLLPGMTASVTIITAQRSGVLLLPASALTFARTAAIPSNGILTLSQDRAALVQARQMLVSLIASNPQVQQDKPTATIVLQRINGKWQATPVVLGLTDGTRYEVLAGLNQGDQVVIGEIGGLLPTPASGSGTGGGGRGGNGGFGGFGGGGKGG